MDTKNKKTVNIGFVVLIVILFGISVFFIFNRTIENPKNASIPISTTSTTNPTNPTSTQKTPQADKVFKGSWFDVKYPANFIPRPISPAGTRNGQATIVTDEAYFASPDEAVEFYVFSPLWGSDPDYIQVKANEILVDEKTQTTGTGFDKKITRWVTVKANDGSYLRSWVSYRDQVGTGSDTHKVFGIRYKNSSTYNKHLNQYLAFKNSLQQYAD